MCSVDWASPGRNTLTHAAARKVPIGHFKIIDFERTSTWRYIYVNTNVSSEHDLE